MKKSQKTNHFNSIESTIATAMALIEAGAPAGSRVEREAVAKGKSCKGIINVFHATDLYNPEASATDRFRSFNRNADTSYRIGSVDRIGYGQYDYVAEPAKPKRKAPSVRYAFYESTYYPSRIGSVAIYAANLTPFIKQLRRNMTLFGLNVIAVKIENGRRPFLDVTLSL